VTGVAPWAWAWPWADVARVDAEQALYGSFPFRHRGYEVVAHSPGCRRAWLDAFARACVAFGERPAGVTVEGALFALPIAGEGAWMVVGVGEAGEDDRGRPGALAFHAWFVADRDYRRAGAAPFPFAPHHRTRWDSDPGALPAKVLRLERFRAPPGPPDPRAAAVAHRLRHRRPVAIEAPGPIDALTRDAWALLPPRARGRLGVATWAFGNANRFDLVAVPRRAMIESDPAFVESERLLDPPPPRWRDRLARRGRAALQSPP
jgi:hypothetical protein